MSTLREQDRLALEGMLDRSTLADVIRALADICNAKAEHIEANWQDKRLATLWGTAANACDRFAVNPFIRRVP